MFTDFNLITTRNYETFGSVFVHVQRLSLTNMRASTPCPFAALLPKNIKILFL